jgi:hypothetical protein
MTNYELAEELAKLVRQERKITNEILTLIHVALERRSYLELGFSSMFDWLVKGFGYSHSAAYRRIEAARLMKAVPEVSAMLEDGQVNLTTLSKAQSIIKNHEKLTGNKVSPDEKSEIIGKIENKTTEQTEQVLFSLFPEVKDAEKREQRRPIDENTSRVSVNLPNEAVESLQRAKEILSHKFPHASDGDIIAYALNFLVAKTEPVTQSAAAPASKRVRSEDHTKAGARRMIFKKYQGRCCFKDPLSGRICGSRYQVQTDHIIPRALGGSDHPSNLRLLCRQHNLLLAEKSFGKRHMERYRTPL